MWGLANLMTLAGDYRSRAYREPPNATVLPPDVFGALVLSQPWRSVWRWQDAHYQYAICEKGPTDTAARADTKQRTERAREDYSI